MAVLSAFDLSSLAALGLLGRLFAPFAATAHAASSLWLTVARSLDP
jgi:hypothetical protein